MVLVGWRWFRRQEIHCLGTDIINESSDPSPFTRTTLKRSADFEVTSSLVERQSDRFEHFRPGQSLDGAAAESRVLACRPCACLGGHGQGAGQFEAKEPGNFVGSKKALLANGPFLVQAEQLAGCGGG